MPESALTQGLLLASRGRYADAIRVMEAEEITSRDSWRFCYTLGLCHLRVGTAGAALDCFKAAYKLRQNEPLVLQGLGLLYLRRGESARAVDFYLRAKNLAPADRLTRRALETLRRYGGSEEFPQWLESGKYRALIPPFPKLPGLARRRLVSAARVLLVLVLGLGLALAGRRFGPEVLSKIKPPPREGLAASALAPEEKAAPVGSAGSFRLILTQGELLRVYEKARRLFTEYRDDAARVEINRILESNATEDVKNKARLLASFLGASNFDTLKDKYTFAQVAAEPWLYRDCAVVWRGMAANIVLGERSTDFDFLVGFDKRSVLEGTVHVHFDQSLAVSADTPVEVLGDIEPADAVFTLRGRALHQLPVNAP